MAILTICGTRIERAESVGAKCSTPAQHGGMHADKRAAEQGFARRDDAQERKVGSAREAPERLLQVRPRLGRTARQVRARACGRSAHRGERSGDEQSRRRHERKEPPCICNSHGRQCGRRFVHDLRDSAHAACTRNVVWHDALTTKTTTLM